MLERGGRGTMRGLVTGKLEITLECR